jgi:hypothetical protein
VAQRASGQSQAAYCRARGLDPKYFTVWKRKLAACGAPPARAPQGSASRPPLRLVPLVVKEASSTESSTATEPVSIHLKLPNGLSVSLQIPMLRMLPALLVELAQTPC